MGAARGADELRGTHNRLLTFIMGHGKTHTTADDETLSAADDRDPAAIKFFKLLKSSSRRCKPVRLGFTQKISPKNRDELLKLRDDYLQVLKKLAEEKERIANEKKRTAEEKKRIPKGDPKVVEQLEAERLRLLNRIPARLVTEWIAAIDAEITDAFKKHPAHG